MNEKPITIEVRKTMQCPCGIEIAVARSFYVFFTEKLTSTAEKMREHDNRVTDMAMREFSTHVETEHKNNA